MHNIKEVRSFVYNVASGYFDVTHSDASTSVVTFLDAVPSGLSLIDSGDTLSLIYVDRHGVNQTLLADLSPINVGGFSFNESNSVLTLTFNDSSSFIVNLSTLASSGGSILTLSGTSLVHGSEIINLCSAVDQCVNTSSGLSFNDVSNILTLTLDDGSTLTTDLSTLDVTVSGGEVSLISSGTSLIHGAQTINLCPLISDCGTTVSGISFNTSTNILSLTFKDSSSSNVDLTSLINSGDIELSLSGTSLLHGAQTINLCPAVDQCVNTVSGLSFNTVNNILTLTVDDGSTFTSDLSSLDVVVSGGEVSLVSSGTSLIHGAQTINLCSTISNCGTNVSGISFNSSSGILSLVFKDDSTSNVTLSSLTSSGTSLVFGDSIINLCPIANDCVRVVTGFSFNPSTNIISITFDDASSITQDLSILDNSGTAHPKTATNISYSHGSDLLTLTYSDASTSITTISGVPTLELSGSSLLHGAQTIELCPAVFECVNTASGLSFNSSSDILTLTLDDGTTLTTDLSTLRVSGLVYSHGTEILTLTLDGGSTLTTFISGAPAGGTNIYNTSDTLTANRVVTHTDKSLLFIGSTAGTAFNVEMDNATETGFLDIVPNRAGLSVDDATTTQIIKVEITSGGRAECIIKTRDASDGGAGATALQPLQLQDTSDYVVDYGLGLPSFADNAAALVGGLISGQFFMTNARGSSPLNVSGLVLIVQ